MLTLKLGVETPDPSDGWEIIAKAHDDEALGVIKRYTPTWQRAERPLRFYVQRAKRWATHAMAANARTITITYVQSTETSRIVAEGQSKEKAIVNGVSR